MQQDGGSPVRRTGRGDVHIAHGQRLALRGEGVVADRPWVFEALQLRAERGRVGASGRKLGGEREGEVADDERNADAVQGRPFPWLSYPPRS